MKTNIIFKTVVGSQAYGTSTPTSDIDIKGVYLQSNEEILTGQYRQQFEVSKDETYYEVARFLDLLRTANPTVLELLFMPEEHVIHKSPVFDIILKHKQAFLTKQARNSFGGYAVAQIKKAKGTDKMMNMEQEQVKRKTPLDFCFIYEDAKAVPLTSYMKNNTMKEEFCGLVNVDHMKDCYTLYYDNVAEYAQNANHRFKTADGDTPTLGFKGICGEESNSLRLSSIPSSYKVVPEALLYYNEDGYVQHCKKYNEYQVWLVNHNKQRFVDVKGHGQKIDGKNLLHCRRLLDMAMEIATQKTIKVKRPNADYLLSIRKGEVDLDTIINQAELDIKKLDELYAKSDLPDVVPDALIQQILKEIRYYEKS
jgi:hypothetical protein